MNHSYDSVFELKLQRLFAFELLGGPSPLQPISFGDQAWHYVFSIETQNLFWSSRLLGRAPAMMDQPNPRVRLLGIVLSLRAW